MRFAKLAPWVALMLVLSTAIMLLVAGCGGSKPAAHKPLTLQRGPESCIPPEGKGVAGACHKPTHGFVKRGGALTRGIFPDVSEFQGNVDWGAASPHMVGAVLRVQDDYWADTKFRRNVEQVRSHGIQFAVYAFVRPESDCSVQAHRALGRMAAVAAYSARLIGDFEVPLPYWCMSQFSAAVESAQHVSAVDYTSPGTKPPGPHGRAQLWVADYGPVRGCVETWPCIGGRAASVAWQCTDGVYGCVTYVPGIGRDDVSMNEGLFGGSSPAPSNRVLHERLNWHYGNRSKLRRLILVHQCAPGDHRHATPKGYREVCNDWLEAGRLENAKISYYHSKGIY